MVPRRVTKFALTPRIISPRWAVTLSKSAVTLKLVPPIAKVVVYTFGARLTMFLVIPPAVRRVAPSLVVTNV